MSKKIHKACYGTMFHDTLQLQENEPMRGKVFSFEVDRMGLEKGSRGVDAEMTEWDDCLDCEEFNSCYKLCMAKLLLQTTIGQK